MLVITPDYPPAKGGIQLLTERLVQNWHAVDRHVITTAAAPSDYTETSDGVLRAPRPAVGGRVSAFVALNGAAVLEATRYRPDVVLSSHITCSPAARTIRRLLGPSYAQYAYGQEIPAHTRIAAFAMKRADAVIAISAYTEQLALDRGAPPNRLRRIPPGVDLPTVTAGIRADRPTIVTVARLRERYKGHDVLIRALPLIRDAVPNVQWVVVGDGPERSSYESEVHARGLDDNVSFVGVVEDGERDAWLDRAHVFVMPSRLSDDGGGEGFGIVYLEAGAHGLPVIAGDVAGARDAVIDGETGRLVDPADHLKVAEAAIELLTNLDLSKQMGAAGQRNAADLAWPHIATRVEQVLLELIDASASSS